MKKVVCLVLALMLMVPVMGGVSAAEGDFGCYWATERDSRDSLGSAVIYYTVYPEAQRYMVDVYKDGQLVDTREEFSSTMDEEGLCVLDDLVLEHGNGAYTCTVSAVSDAWGFVEGAGTVYATTPMSNPYVYTEPTTMLPPVTNVRFANNEILFDHDKMGLSVTYSMECYIEYGDVCGHRFSGNSAFKPMYAADRFKYVLEGYESQLAEDKEENPELVQNGEPKLLLVIYAKAWNINDARTSSKTYFYPNGEKPTYTVANEAWTVSNNATISFDGTVSALEAYNISDNNYFKLRDIAMALTEKMDFQVDVTWDGEKNAINLITGQPYTQVGGEMKAGDNAGRQAVLSDAKVYLNGEEIQLTAYNINDNNFFKLRDLCSALGVEVGWDEAAQLIMLNK